MNTIMIILYTVAGIVALLLIIAIFMRKVHRVSCGIVIHAPVQEVFGFLRLLANQEKFNPWAKADAHRKEETRGTDGTVGFVYSWSGDKSAGQGEKEIMNIEEGKRIETEIRFVKPMRVSASVIFETTALSEAQTKVNLVNTGSLPYPMNLLIPIFEKNFAKDMDKSLVTLKGILEK